MHDGVARISRREQHLEVGWRLRASSASCRPFMPPGRPTSVKRTAISGWLSSICSAAARIRRFENRDSRARAGSRLNKRARPSIVFYHEDDFALRRAQRSRPVPLRHSCNIGMRPRQIDFDGRAFANLAVDFDVAARLLDEAVDLRESEAGAVSDILGGKEGVEGLRHHVGRHADAVIGDREHDILAGQHLRLCRGIVAHRDARSRSRWSACRRSASRRAHSPPD